MKTGSVGGFIRRLLGGYYALHIHITVIKTILAHMAETSISVVSRTSVVQTGDSVLKVTLSDPLLCVMTQGRWVSFSIFVS